MQDTTQTTAQAAVATPAAAQAAATFMTVDQARDWAWNKVREDVGTKGWKVFDSINFHGFFLHGWNYRGQYELQRSAARELVPAPAAVAVPDDRAAFERELIDNHHYVPSDFSFKDGFYGGDDDYIQFGWDVWKARAALTATPAADIGNPITGTAAPVVLPEPAAVVTFEWRKKPDVKWLIDTVVRGTKLYTEQQVRALLAGVSAPAAQAVEPTDAELIALNAGECYFGESPSKYPELGHGTQYHAGAPGVLGFARAALALRSDPAAYSQKFQQRVQPWMMTCFGPEISADRIERNHRFLEESLELVQSLGCTASEAHQLVDYVFGRPAGEPAQEAGGVMVTLAALCLASGLDMHACGETELTRIWTKVEAIRAKQAAKPKHSPLPMQAHQTQDALRLAFVLSEIRRGGMDALTAALHDLDGFPLDHQASVEAIDRAAIAAAKGE